MPKTPTPIAYKTIFQVRYKAELKFYSLFINAAQKFTEYPDWLTDKLSILLKDLQNHCSLAIGHDSFGYEHDFPTKNIDQQYIQHAINELPQSLEITDFIRFGYRQIYLLSANMDIESLTSILQIKLFSQEQKLRNILPGSIENLIYRVNGEDEPYKYTLTIRPIQKADILSLAGINLEKHFNPQTFEQDFNKLEKIFPETACLVDIDIFQLSQALSGEELTAFVAISREKITKYSVN